MRIFSFSTYICWVLLVFRIKRCSMPDVLAGVVEEYLPSDLDVQSLWYSDLFFVLTIEFSPSGCLVLTGFQRVWTTIWLNKMPFLTVIVLSVLLLFSWQVICALRRPRSYHCRGLLINCLQSLEYFSPCPFCRSNFWFYLGRRSDEFTLLHHAFSG